MKCLKIKIEIKNPISLITEFDTNEHFKDPSTRGVTGGVQNGHLVKKARFASFFFHFFRGTWTTDSKNTKTITNAKHTHLQNKKTAKTKYENEIRK